MAIQPDQPTALVLELIRHASRDLSTYITGGPNAYAAGEACVRGIDAAMTLLTRTHAALVADMRGDTAGGPAQALGRVSAERWPDFDRDTGGPHHGNSGPGGPLSKRRRPSR